MSVLEIVLLCFLGAIVIPSFFVGLVCSLLPDKEIVVVKRCLLLSNGDKVYKVFGFDDTYVYIWKKGSIIRYRRVDVRYSSRLDDESYFCFKIDEL